MEALLPEDQVLAKCDYFVDVHLWPRQPNLDPRRWLANFLPAERPYAVHLLGVFQYFSEELVNALLLGAFQDLSRSVVAIDATAQTADAQWTDFLRSLIVTYPTGEAPNPTDSGHTFARKARQVLGIPEQRILSPEAAVLTMARSGPRPVVFLDDFLGSGSQFVQTWQRRYKLNGSTTSFESLASRLSLGVYYLPLIATTLGRRRLSTIAPAVSVLPAHDLPVEASSLHPDSAVWPASERAQGQRVVEAASKRAGFPESGGHDTKDWRGFAELGLAFAFAHGVPDATLPLFHGESADWFPLVRRV